MIHPKPWVLAAALLVACGGDKDDPPATTPGTTPTTTDTGTVVTTTADTTTTTTVIGPTGDTGPEFPLLHEPLGMPEEPTVDPADFTSAQVCENCHEDHAREWSQSMHAYAIVDPVYQQLVRIRQADFQGSQDKFCLQCHSPIGTRGGEIQPGFSFDDLSPIVEEGVTCESCHKISSVERVNNAGHVLDPSGPIRGPIQNPDPSPAHSSEYSELFDQDAARLCGSCHDVIETSGLNLERPYEEFVESPAYAEGGRCQTCHMPETTKPIVTGGPDREHSNHRFIGVEVPLAEGFLTPAEEASVREDVHNLLEGSVQLDLEVPEAVLAGEQLDLVVTVTNLIDAHNFPTGTTFNRQAWLEITATDAVGNVLYQTGDLDSNGDLRNFWSEVDPYGDDDLIMFSSQLIDINGTPNIFSWKATEHWVASIPPLLDRTFTLFVPTEQAVQGPITVSGRVRFRSYGPYVMRALELDHLADRLEIVDIDVNEVTVPVSGLPTSGTTPTGDTGSAGTGTSTDTGM